MIWWHSWASCSPLVVSPSTNSELKRVNVVWIGFNLPIRQYEAGGMLQVFSILPQENCVRFCKCTSADTSARRIDRQLVQIKNWQSSEPSGSTLETKYLQKHMHMTTENKNKVIPSAGSQKTVCPWCWKDIFQIVEKKRVCAYFFPLQS